MKKRQVNWAFGNPACTAWEVETAAGLLVVRRNHALVRAGARWRQGWDVWLGGKFAGALSSRTLSDLATRGHSAITQFQVRFLCLVMAYRGGRRMWLIPEARRCRNFSTTSKAPPQNSTQEIASIKACKLDTYQFRIQSNPSKKKHL